MIQHPDEAAAAFAGTELADGPWRSVPLPDTDGAVVLVAPVEDGTTRRTWAAARELVDVPGRWPVLGGGFYLFDDLLLRSGFGSGAEPGVDTSVAAVLAGSRDFDAVTALEAWRDSYLGPGYEYLPFELERTERRMGTAPTEDEVRAALGPSPTHVELDRWLLEWEEERGGGEVAAGGHLEPLEPDRGVELLLLPVDEPAAVLAHLLFFGAWGPGRSDRLIAIVRSWRERYGAELSGHYGTVLQFAVARPPQSLDEAWLLAREQVRVAPCTTAPPGVTLRDHARALVDRDTWFLHERP